MQTKASDHNKKKSLKKTIAAMQKPFEEALAELESVVKQLESGDVSLDQAVKLYEKANLLYQYCAQKLSTAQLKISEIQFDAKFEEESAEAN